MCLLCCVRSQRLLWFLCRKVLSACVRHRPRHFIQVQHRDPCPLPRIGIMWFSFKVGNNQSHIVLGEKKHRDHVYPTVKLQSHTNSAKHKPPTPPWSLHALLVTPPTQVPSIVSRQKGGFSSNCCTLQKALCWTHSGCQWRPYILRSALSLCHGGLWMSSLLGCGSVHRGGDWGRGRKQVVCALSLLTHKCTAQMVDLWSSGAFF